MASDESDDEPLSVLAANKKINPEQFEDTVPQTPEVPKKKKRKIVPPKRLAVTIKLQKSRSRPPPVIERPADVWLYLKDLNPAGPYSCLLCSEWFINRSKLICHYVLNHKKDFCGICRYFVPDRESWLRHIKFHTPWPCSQCIQNFLTEVDLRDHLRMVHNLVHCRLCHFRVLDGDPYHNHLLKKHNITNVASKDADPLWELENDKTSSFLCVLCSKPNNESRTFFTHFMGVHHFTLKCFTGMISGRDPPFTVSGADLRPEFIEEQLKTHSRYGYVDSEYKPPLIHNESEQGDTKDLLNALIPEIKQEIIANDDNENENLDENEAEKARKDKLEQIYKSYNGDEDFDVTVMEVIFIQKCYYDYICDILSDINAKSVYEFSDIDYDKLTTDIEPDVLCILCDQRYKNMSSFTTHLIKMHCVKSFPVYSCRICAAIFDSQAELDNHTVNELSEFEDLWICQFCEKEFDDREATRRHLNEHWDLLEYDNCFSPHLGFKCKYCPTLFWHETDRETHQLRTHFFNHKEEYYKCETCGDVFSDKVWYVHHYLEKHSVPNKVPVFLLKCTLCCLVLPTVEEMRAHFKTEHPEAKKVFCSLDPCKYKPLSHRKSFKLHVRTIHCSRGRRDRIAECSVCGRQFSSSRACGTHMAQAHGHAGKFKCKLCREVLHTTDERKLHYLLRHPGQHPFECNQCGKSFQYKSSLYIHKQEHIPNKEKFTCTYCGKIFMKKDSYREHIQIHEGPRHACSYCPMRFVQRSNMLRHERRHTGERPYACPHCPRSFADKGACNSHARTHSKSASYACMYCGKTFVQKSKLTYHIRKHTGENLETCSVCSKMFTSACSLREHMKIHEPKRDLIKCPLCDRKYQDERYMLRHLRTSHTRARHPCPLCDKMLTSAASLRHHVITHSDLKTLRCKLCPKAYAVRRTMIRHFRRRHGFKGSEPNIKEFYTRLDPRECNLGLDEPIMTSIFGPPRSQEGEVIVSDFVTYSNLEQQRSLAEQEKIQDSQNTESAQNEQSPEGEKSTENDTGPVEEINKIIIKVEPKDDSDQELEPTDFVSVKIEPMDDENA